MPSGSSRNTPLTSLGTPSSIIKSHIMDLEGPSYSFRSLFHLPGATKVRFSAMLFQLFLMGTFIFGIFKIQILHLRQSFYPPTSFKQ